jgi:hypothetical protein
MDAPTSDLSAPAAAAPEGHAMAQTLAMLHPWIDFVPRQQRRLGIFIAIALAVHLAAFFFIRIDATRAELRHQPHTRVTMESSRPALDAEGGDAFWDRLTDPRLFLLPVAPFSHFSADDPPLDFATINSNIGPRRLPPAAQVQSYPFMPAAGLSVAEQAQAEMHPARQSFSYDETPIALPQKTQWQWDPALAARQPAHTPDLPSPISDTDLSPTELRVAVGPGGSVKHVLLEDTCQKPELDQVAILAAQKLLFRPTDQPGLEWGRITVFWHYTTKPVDVIVPTPPSP